MMLTPGIDAVGAGSQNRCTDRVPDFNHLAGVYRWLEAATFGNRLMRCRSAFLGQMRASRCALVIGDGDGRFTAQLLRENASVLIDAVDGSREMLRALVSHAGSNRGRVRIHVADARQWETANAPLDLIVTHFFLDCLGTEEVSALARRLRLCVAPDARWVISEFAIPQNWFGRLVARPLIAILYLAFGWLTGLRVRRLPKYRKALADAGFVMAQERRSVWGLLVAEIWKPRLRQNRVDQSARNAAPSRILSVDRAIEGVR